MLRTRHPRFHLARGLLLILSSGLAFLSLSRLPVGEFTPVVMVTPLLVTLMAARLWGERVAPLQWLFVAGGFLGTLLIWSFQQAPASTLMPFMYAQIAFGMLGGWMIFDYRPDGLSVGGMLLIAASGVGAALFSARASVRALESTEH